MARRRPQANELSEFDRKLIGSFIRIEIPMEDIYKLRQVADLLRGFADRIDNHTRRPDLPIRTILLEVKHEGSMTSRAIKALFPSVFSKRWYDHRSE